MEKKNTVLLTVIAVATLLVAVVGATFAYFTATTTGSGAGTANTSTATSTGSVTVTLKDIASAGDVKYPGGVMVNGAEVVTAVSGSGSFSGTYDVNAVITISGMKSANTTIKATMYKTTTKVASELTSGCSMQTGTTTGTNGESVATYFYPSDCKANEDITGGTAVVATQTLTLTDGAVTKTLTAASQAFNSITETATDNAYYYVVLEYINNGENAQNDDMGASVSVQFTGITNAASTAAAQ